MHIIRRKIESLEIPLAIIALIICIYGFVHYKHDKYYETSCSYYACETVLDIPNCTIRLVENKNFFKNIDPLYCKDNTFSTGDVLCDFDPVSSEIVFPCLEKRRIVYFYCGLMLFLIFYFSLLLINVTLQLIRISHMNHADH